MLNKEIISVLSEWNFWYKDISTGIFRQKYADDLYRQKDLKEVTIVTGVRRSGKSTVLLQTLQQLIDNGAPATNILYVNFEEPIFSADLNLDFLSQIFRSYREEFLPQGKIYVALDEVHLVPQWEKFVRGIYDRESQVKFYVTDSSSHLLSDEYGRALTGRTFTNTVYPLSFSEYLKFNHLEKLLDGDPRMSDLKSPFLRYLEFGGFPQVTLTPSDDDKAKLLKEYYFAIIEKDIISRYGVRDARQFKEFALFAISNSGLTVSGYAAEKKQEIPQPTANKFLDYLQEVFLLSQVRYFSYSLTKQRKWPAKVYCVDTGLYNAVSFQFSENIGRSFENAVYLGLKRAGLEVFYWQNKKETDFLARVGRKVNRLVNVCWDLNENNKEREISALSESMKEFNIDKSEIITMGCNEKITTDVGTIEIKDFLSLPEFV